MKGSKGRILGLVPICEPSFRESSYALYFAVGGMDNKSSKMCIRDSNNIVQSAGAIELTGKLSLEGTKEKGIDDYTDVYKRQVLDRGVLPLLP